MNDNTVHDQSLNVLFGQRIRQIRNERHMSQEEFAWMVGLHRTYLGQVERAEKNITLKNIEKIANALNIDPKELFNFDNLTSGEGAEALNNAGFALRGGLHCAPSAHKALGTLPTGAIRFSPSAFNKRQEVKEFCAAVRKISLK